MGGSEKESGVGCVVTIPMTFASSSASAVVERTREGKRRRGRWIIVRLDSFVRPAVWKCSSYRSLSLYAWP